MDPSVDNVCHDIIMEYLMHSCYKNTAKAFDTEYKKQRQYSTILMPPSTSSHKPDAMDVDEMDCTPTSTNVVKGDLFFLPALLTLTSIIHTGHASVKDEKSWIQLDARKDLYTAIEAGDIPKAFDLIQKRFPGLVQNTIFDANCDNEGVGIDMMDATMDAAKDDKMRTYRVLFKLRCQHFIEIVRSSNEVEAIRYAHQYLRPLQNLYQDMITEVASLIAYAKPEQSNQAHLLSQDRRQQLAEEVNCIALAYCNMPEQTSIEKLQQQCQVVQQELEAMKKMDEKTSNRDKLAV
ncbi:hypothetical protein [Absidia glauca]|uniref:CTLH domain-containing protein n=1 Tax=Absidia glauca TaxID=4829 RepID=A0A168Q8J4_ABSGL|nr:hypothetical protein [Absidia glauca]